MKEELKSGTYLIEITKVIAYMPVDMYIQEATYNDVNNRFYVKRGAAGNISIGLKSAKVLKVINEL